MSNESKIMTGVFVGVVAAMIGLFVLTNSGSSPSADITDAGKVVREDSSKLVEGDGKVTLVEFADFECEACRAAKPTIERLTQEYEGKLTVVIRNFPLPMHRNSQPAHNAAEAAREQGKYKEMYMKLYEKQDEWSRSTSLTNDLVGYATEVGVTDTAAVRQAIEGKKYQSKIDVDMADGTALGVNATPTIYINGQKQADARYETLKQAIDAALK